MARWLRKLSPKSSKSMDGVKTAEPSETQDAVQFLRETLHLVSGNQDDQQQLYPAWAQQQAHFNTEISK